MEKQIRMLTETDYTEIDNKKADKIDMPTKISQLQDDMGYGVDIRQLHETKADKSELPKTMNDLIVSNEYPEPGGYLLMEMEEEIGKFQQQLDEVKHYGVEGNNKLVDALNSKGVEASTDDSIQTNIAKVDNISSNNFNEAGEIPTHIPTNSIVFRDRYDIYITHPENVHIISIGSNKIDNIIKEHKTVRLAPMNEAIISYKMGKFIVTLGNHRNSMSYTYHNTETNNPGSIRVITEITQMKWAAINTRRKEILVVDTANNLHKLTHTSDNIIGYTKLLKSNITSNHKAEEVDTAGLLCSNIHRDAEIAVGVYNVAFDTKTEDTHNVSYPPGTNWGFLRTLRPLVLNMVDTEPIFPDAYGELVTSRMVAHVPNEPSDYDTVVSRITNKNPYTSYDRNTLGIISQDFSILYGKNGLDKNLLQHKTKKREFLVPNIGIEYAQTFTKLVVPEYNDNKTAVVALGGATNGVLYSDGVTTKVLLPNNR